MTVRSSTSLVWIGFVVSLIALLTYPFLFVRWPLTRDFPWVNLLLLAAAIMLVATGVRRVFVAHATRGKKVGAVLGATLSGLVLTLFVWAVFVFARQLPASHGAPQVGQKAPEFVLSDTAGKQVALSELLSAPLNGQAPKGVLLIFYRGYW